VNLAHGLHVRPVFVALRAAHHGEFLRGGFASGGQEASRAGGIGGDRLLGEDMFAGFHGGLEVNRTIAGRRGQHDDIEVALGQFLVGVEADEVAVGRHLDARLYGFHQVLRGHLLRFAVALHGDAGVARQVLRVAQVLDRPFQVVLEDIRHGDKFHVLVAGEQVHGGLRAAPAAADKSGAQFLLSGAAHQMGLDDSECRRARRQQPAPGNRIR
jgi:hypothetical protein